MTLNLDLEDDYKLDKAFTFIQGLRTVSRRLRGEIVVDADQLLDTESLVTGKTIDYDSENEGDLLEGKGSGRRKVGAGTGAVHTHDTKYSIAPPPHTTLWSRMLVDNTSSQSAAEGRCDFDPSYPTDKISTSRVQRLAAILIESTRNNCVATRLCERLLNQHSCDQRRCELII